MSPELLHEKYGEPDLKICDFEMWIYDYEFPRSKESNNDNWLITSASCRSMYSYSCIHGPILQTSTISYFLNDLKKMYDTLKGAAELPVIEPNLSLGLYLHSPSLIEVKVNMSQEHSLEDHTYTYEIDQSYLPQIIRQLKNILSKYPL